MFSLKKHYDLIPNLVEVVKDYKEYEAFVNLKHQKIFKNFKINFLLLKMIYNQQGYIIMQPLENLIMLYKFFHLISLLKFLFLNNVNFLVLKERKRSSKIIFFNLNCKN